MQTSFTGTPHAAPWIELYHSRPSWRRCLISYRADGGAWVPFGTLHLVDANTVRPGFRCFRIRAKRLEFSLANGTGPRAHVDGNSGKGFVVDAPGRYVVESGGGVRRVGDACIEECLRPLRPRDQFVELVFQTGDAGAWGVCFVTFARCQAGVCEDEWKTAAMKAWGSERGDWFYRVRIGDDGKGLDCAFNDGADHWDSNNSLNYAVRLPGKYLIANGRIKYLGPSDLDIHVVGD